VLALISSGSFAVLAADAAEPSVAIMRQRLEASARAMNGMRSRGERWNCDRGGILVLRIASFSEVANPLLKYCECVACVRDGGSDGQEG